MRSVRRIFYRVLAAVGVGIAALVLLVLATVAYLVGTTSGGRFALRALDRLPITANVGAFDGRLAGRFELRNVTVDAPPVTASADRVVVAWRPLALLGRRLDVHSVEIDGLAVAITAAPLDTAVAAPDTASAGPGGRPDLPVEIELGELVLRDGRLTAPGVAVTVPELSAAGNIDAARVSARASVEAEGYPEARVSVGARASWRDAQLDSLVASVERATVSLRGEASWSPDVRWDVYLSARDVEPGVILGDTTAWSGKVSLRGATRGELAADGPRAFARIDTLTGTLRGYPLDGHITLEATPSGANIDELVLALAGGGIRASGNVTWSPEKRWALSVDARGVDPAGITPAAADWSGHIDLSARTEGELNEGGVFAWARIDTLEGELRGHALHGRAAGRVRGRDADIDSLVLALGSNRVRASGVLGDSLALGVEATLPDLSVAHPEAGGAVQMKVRADGPRTGPRLNARVRVDALHFQDYHAAQVRVDAEADLASRGGGVNANVHVDSLVAAGRNIDLLELRVGGRQDAHTMSAVAHAGSTQVRIAARGAYADETWTGTLDTLAARGIPGGDWHMAESATISARPTRVSVSGLMLETNGTSISLDGRWARGDSALARAQIRRIPASLAQLALPIGWTATGSIDASADVALLPDGRLRAAVMVPPAAVEFRIPVGEGHEVLRLDSTSVSLRVDSTGLDANLGVNLVYRREKVAHLRAEAVAAELTRIQAFTMEAPLSMRIDAGAQDLAFVGRLMPAIAPTAGHFRFTAEGEGSLADLPLRWELVFAEGRAGMRTYGLSLRDVALSGRGVRGEGFTLEGMARSGGGELRLESEIERNEEGRRSRIHIRGRRFQVIKTAQVQVTVSPDVTVDVAGKKITVEGDVVIPWAKIDLIDVPQSAVGESQDVVIVGEEVHAEAPIDVTARMRVALGDSVEFRGFNLDAMLEGSILVIEEPGRPTAGSGELRIEEGKYNAYGQLLQVDPGVIVFTGGPIDNPGLDIRAYRKTNDGVMAGVRVRGTARSPRIEVFSEPAMSQTEALSYLITGRPLDQSGSQSDMVAAAALSMGMQTGNVMTQSMGREIGLDEARLEMTGSGAAAFTAGKYLSPQLYISNTVGLFDQSVIWRVEYILTARWSVQAESGVATGSDLLYKIEK